MVRIPWWWWLPSRGTNTADFVSLLRMHRHLILRRKTDWVTLHFSGFLLSLSSWNFFSYSYQITQVHTTWSTSLQHKNTHIQCKPDISRSCISRNWIYRGRMLDPIFWRPRTRYFLRSRGNSLDPICIFEYIAVLRVATLIFGENKMAGKTTISAKYMASSWLFMHRRL